MSCEGQGRARAVTAQVGARGVCVWRGRRYGYYGGVLLPEEGDTCV